ncbi:RHS repeat domain-containing protein [Dysgonomonas termitidis]|uniref:RHS repeat domain-containing protein n=1 Tax=Dysgonomonas termitidis TaxID=1516126 RepID=A0ABV9L2Y0_9BACT
MIINSPTAKAKNYYTYSASGVKLRTEQRYDPNLNVSPVNTTNPANDGLPDYMNRDYAGNIIYETAKNGSAITNRTRILVDGGYWENNVYYFYVTDHLGNNRVVVNQSGTVTQKNHYYPFGTAFADKYDNGTNQPYKYNGKELDGMHQLNLYDYSARYYESALGRFTSVDPHAEKYYSISPYVYCNNNPLKYIDPDGKDGIFIAFPDYKISTPVGKVGGLGHAGVLLIDNKTGYTKYYEYGRYDKEEKGLVQTHSVSNVKIGKDGKPTEESLNKVLGQISDKAGQKGKIEGAYVESDKFDEMKDYAESKKAENSNSDRKEYTLTGNNCGTFAADVLKQDPDVKKKAPTTIIARPNGMVKDWQSNFEKITYDPNKDKKE